MEAGRECPVRKPHGSGPTPSQAWTLTLCSDPPGLSLDLGRSTSAGPAYSRRHTDETEAASFASLLSDVNKEMAMNLLITKVPHLLISFLGVSDERHLVKTVGSGARQPGFQCQVYSHGTTGKWLHSVPPQAFSPGKRVL